MSIARRYLLGLIAAVALPATALGAFALYSVSQASLPDEAEARAIFTGLHRDIYGAFDHDDEGAIYEALGLINEQLWLGHFEMWSGSGLVVFRHATILDTRDSDGLSLEQAESISEAALEECERFYPVFQFVLWGGKSPGEAIAAALIDTHGEA